MRINILAVGTRMQPWVYAGFENYRKRMPAQIQLALHEIATGTRKTRGKNAGAKDSEAEQLLKRSASADLTIALDETGEAWSSKQLAGEMRDWLQNSPQVALLIGGPDGLTDACRDRAERIWSLSKLTLPHGLVRVVLAEQLYRGWTILQGHPYHRS